MMYCAQIILQPVDGPSKFCCVLVHGVSNSALLDEILCIDLMSAFAVFDKNGDGIIDKDELVCSMCTRFVRPSVRPSARCWSCVRVAASAMLATRFDPARLGRTLRPE
jgi:hypothetical protein